MGITMSAKRTITRDGPHSLYKYWTKISGSSMMSESAQERNDLPAAGR